MTHTRVILNHLRLSGMLGILQSKITGFFLGYILLPLLCSMLLISPNFGQGLFPILLEKALEVTHCVHSRL